MKIATKIRIAAVGLVVLSASASAYLVFLGYDAVVTSLQVEYLQNRVDLEIERLDVAFKEIDHDIQILAGLPTITQIADHETEDAETPALQHAKADLAVIFRQMLQAKPHYDQIRLIGVSEGGREIIRLNRVNGTVQQAPGEELQEKGLRPYFQEATAVPPGSPYYSRVNLNWEWNRIETPHRPMLRLAIPVADSSGQLFGIVIINLNFEAFIRTLFENKPDRYRYYLTNAEGYYLMHPDPGQTFGFDLDKDYRVQNDHPEMAGFLTSEAIETTFRKNALFASSAGLVHFQKCSPVGDRLFAFGMAASFDDVAEASTRIGRDAVILIISCIVGSSLLAIWFANRLTRPLRRITSAAHSLITNRSSPDLPEDREDEIGALAQTFNRMRREITEHEAELHEKNRRLSEINEDLEHFNHISSHELREPIRRISALSRLYQIEAQEGSTEETAELLERLDGECERALQQIADFRVFSRISQGKLERELVDLNRVTHEVLTEFTQVLTERRAKLEIADLPVVEGYETLLQVLYRNLIENALIHSKNQNILIKLTLDESSPRKIFGVYNSGSTVDTDHFKRIFDPFVKGPTPDEQNSGMGLAICKRIVERHGGEISVRSGEDFVHILFTLETR